MPDPAPNTYAALAAAIWELAGAAGLVATDNSVRDRKDAAEFMRALESLPPAELTRDSAWLQWYPKTPLSTDAAWTTLDLPSGRSERVKLVLLSNEAGRPAELSEAERKRLRDNVETVLEFELPVILPRWFFDQVMGPWLGEMRLSASMVLSVQRSVVVVNGDLMVRLTKMMSDPRSQMVSMREQTVRNLQGEFGGVRVGRRPLLRPPTIE